MVGDAQQARRRERAALAAAAAGKQLEVEVFRDTLTLVWRWPRVKLGAPLAVTGLSLLLLGATAASRPGATVVLAGLALLTLCAGYLWLVRRFNCSVLVVEHGQLRSSCGPLPLQRPLRLALADVERFVSGGAGAHPRVLARLRSGATRDLVHGPLHAEAVRAFVEVLSLELSAAQ